MMNQIEMARTSILTSLENAKLGRRKTEKIRRMIGDPLKHCQERTRREAKKDWSMTTCESVK